MINKIEQKWLQRVLQLVPKAGWLAMDLIDHSRPTLKADRTVVTKADKAISKLFKTTFKDIFNTKDHILIDEEDEGNTKYFNQKTLESAPYIWSIDPIDGTMAYSNRLPTFGISIGVLKELKPWLGIVYLPVFQELYYSDGKKSYLIKHAFTRSRQTLTIRQVDQIINRHSVFFGSVPMLNRYHWDSSLCQLMVQACAVIDLCWPAVGRVCGSYFHSNLWDLAGSWPIFRSAGLDLRTLTDGKIVDQLDVSIFKGEGDRVWKFKDICILSSERNFPLIQKNLSVKPTK